MIIDVETTIAIHTTISLIMSTVMTIISDNDMLVGLKCFITYWIVNIVINCLSNNLLDK